MLKRIPSKRAVLIGLIILTWTAILLFSLYTDTKPKLSKPYVNRDIDSKNKGIALSVTDRPLAKHDNSSKAIPVSPTKKLNPVSTTQKDGTPSVKHDNNSGNKLPESSQPQISPSQKSKLVSTRQPTGIPSKDLVTRDNSSEAQLPKSSQPQIFSSQKSKRVFTTQSSGFPSKDLVKHDNSSNALPISPTPKSKPVPTKHPSPAPLVEHNNSSGGQLPKSVQRQISPSQKIAPAITTPSSSVLSKNLVKDDNISKALTSKPLLPSHQGLSITKPPKTVVNTSDDKPKKTISSTHPSETKNVQNTQKVNKTKSVSPTLSSSLSSNSKPERNLHLPNTTVTYDPSLVVYCHESPFIDCQNPSKSFQENPTGNSTRVYRIGLLRGAPYVKSSLNKYGQCEYKNCFYEGANVTSDTDAIVVYAIHLSEKFKPPRSRKDQLFVLASWESPPHTKASFMRDPNSVWNYQFNLTMTYRVDSDIFSPYARLLFSPTPLKERPDYYKIAKQKTASVAWFATNCQTVSKRFQYVREMQKYIDVDIYGGCGIPCVKGPNAPCMEALPVTYKFYLSFENSLCTDYISEKLFKLFVPNMHIVPVVRGGANYDKYFPNGTMINSAHFPTAKALALHLKELGSDLKAYTRYLEHKDLYRTTYDGSIGSIGCKLCKLLNTQKIESKIIDANAWMVDGHCKDPDDIT